MTREEEIIDKGIEYTMNHHPMCIGGGAFADAMREFNRNAAFEAGAKWADKTMIAKAVEWLKEELIDNRDNFGYAVVSTFDTITLNDLIEDFRKAMLEEE